MLNLVFNERAPKTKNIQNICKPSIEDYYDTK